MITSSLTVAELEQLILLDESEHLEFKEAQTSYDFDKLLKYGCALANEGGGRLILGVTDKRPRRAVGTAAFRDPRSKLGDLVKQLGLRVDVEEIAHPNGRVLVFTFPSRPIGKPLQVNGAFWMRAGEALVPMTNDQLQVIFHEAGHDFSAEICPRLKLDDLETAGIESFRQRWLENGGPKSLKEAPVEKVLADAELLIDSEVTYAAAILFGSNRALGRYLADAEVIYEYRSGEAEIRHQDRVEYRRGLFLFFDELLAKVNARNDRQSFLDGLFRREVATFNERVVREALLNAVCHRDYRQAGSIFVRQYPRRLEVESPGGFPPGITPENALYKQAPRNRRLAEAFARCGLVERSGQGLDIIYRECLVESKSLPSFRRTDKFQVCISLDGQVHDSRFIMFIEKIVAETQEHISLEDLLAINAVYADQPVPSEAKARLSRLVDLGILEQKTPGRHRKFVLARRFYSFLGKEGAYTRAVGLDRETNKALLLKHIKDSTPVGARLASLKEVLPSLSEGQVQKLLREMKDDGAIKVQGATKGAKWFPT